jgi:hypothetical protein
MINPILKFSEADYPQQYPPLSSSGEIMQS